jgi:hypothetical protein
MPRPRRGIFCQKATHGFVGSPCNEAVVRISLPINLVDVAEVANQTFPLDALLCGPDDGAAPAIRCAGLQGDGVGGVPGAQFQRGTTAYTACPGFGCTLSQCSVVVVSDGAWLACQTRMRWPSASRTG